MQSGHAEVAMLGLGVRASTIHPVIMKITTLDQLRCTFFTQRENVTVLSLRSSHMLLQTWTLHFRGNKTKRPKLPSHK